MNEIELLALLVFGHCLADYALQSDFMAKAKNYRTPNPHASWYHVLFAHAAIHGGIVGIITQNVWFGIAETAVHFCIDWVKCSGKISFDFDQTLHYACKYLWVTIYFWWLV